LCESGECADVGVGGGGVAGNIDGGGCEVGNVLKDICTKSGRSWGRESDFGEREAILESNISD